MEEKKQIVFVRSGALGTFALSFLYIFGLGEADRCHLA